MDLVFHCMAILEDTWHFSLGRYANYFYYCSLTQMIIVASVKISYTITLVFLAFKIRSSLISSRELRNGTNNSPLFVVICVIPLINNVIYLGSDIPKMMMGYYQ